jgi:hypothetical protein
MPVQTLWIKQSDPETRDRQLSATVAAMVGICPKDELEGMMAAQLIAAQNAAMESYRRALIGEQTFEGRRENLSQANKLSRTYAVLLDVLNHHRELLRHMAFELDAMGTVSGHGFHPPKAQLPGQFLGPNCPASGAHSSVGSKASTTSPSLS